jgi:hypothetical protein
MGNFEDVSKAISQLASHAAWLEGVVGEVQNVVQGIANSPVGGIVGEGEAMLAKVVSTIETHLGVKL